MDQVKMSSFSAPTNSVTLLRWADDTIWAVCSAIIFRFAERANNHA
jgi:hypothetical protein